LAALSYKRGTVTLASGRTSDFYIDTKQTTLHPEGAHVVGNLVCDHIAALNQRGITTEAVGGITLGADPIATAAAITSHQRGKPVPGFIIRKEPKGHGTRSWLEGGKNIPEGSQVLLVEDVVTTGGSTVKAYERAKECELVPIAVLALVDRLEGGRENLEKLGIPFDSLLTRDDFVKS
jgi:orotate phosphoribosyltransferase